SDLGQHRQGPQMFGTAGEFVIGDEQPERLAPIAAELILVDLLEETALIESRSPREIPGDLLFRGAEDTDGRAMPYEAAKSLPGAFEAQEIEMMQDRGELLQQRDLPRGGRIASPPRKPLREVRHRCEKARRRKIIHRPESETARNGLAK